MAELLVRFAVKLPDGLQFVLGRRPAQGKQERPDDALPDGFLVGSSLGHLPHQPAAKGLGAFDERGIVLQGQCSDGRVGALSASAALDRIGRVEVHQHGERHRALEEDIHAAAVPVRALALLPFDLVGIAEHGDVLRLRRADAGTADAPLQQPAGGQSQVPDDFGFHTQPVLVGQQLVVGVALFQFRPRFGTLPVSGTGEDEPMQPLHAPTGIVHEVMGQPVQQHRVRRGRAHRAEVVRSFHDPAAEVPLPDAVDGHAGRKRVFGRNEPPGQVQAVRNTPGRHLQRWQHFRHVRLDFGAGPQEVAANQQVGFPPGSAFHQGLGHGGITPLGRVLFQPLELPLQPLQAGVHLGVVVQQLLFFGRGKLIQRFAQQRGYVAWQSFQGERAVLVRKAKAELANRVLRAVKLLHHHQQFLARGDHHRLGQSEDGHVALAEPRSNGPAGSRLAVDGGGHGPTASGGLVRLGEVGLGLGQLQAVPLALGVQPVKLQFGKHKVPVSHPAGSLGRQALVRQHFQPHAGQPAQGKLKLHVIYVPFRVLAGGQHRSVLARGERRPVFRAHLGRRNHLPGNLGLMGLFQPLGQPGGQLFLFVLFNTGFELGQLLLVGLQLALVFLFHLGIQRSRDVALLQAVKESVKLVVLPLGDWVVFVRMTLAAFNRQPQPYGARGVGPVYGLFHAVFFAVYAPFAVGQRVAVESGGHALLDGGIGQQVAGQLFDGELVERHVGVQGPNDPFPVTPGPGTRAVLFVAVAVGIAGQVKPVAAPALAVVGRGQRAIHHPLVGVGAGVVDKRFNLLRRRRQTQHVQIHATNERVAIRLGAGGDSFLFQSGQDERVDGVAHPGGVFHPGRFRPNDGLEGPVFGLPP